MRKIVLMLMGLGFFFLLRSSVSAQFCTGSFTCTSSWTLVCTDDNDGSICPGAGFQDCTCREECTGTDRTSACTSCSSRSSSDCSISGACGAGGVSCICTTGSCGWNTGPTPTPGGGEGSGCSSPDREYWCDSSQTNSLFARAYDFGEQTICDNNYFTPVSSDEFCGGSCDWTVQTWTGYVDLPVDGSYSFRYFVENASNNDLRIGMGSGSGGWYDPVDSFYDPSHPTARDDYYVEGGFPPDILTDDYVYICDDGDEVEGSSDCGDEKWDNIRWRRYTTDTWNMRAGRYFIYVSAGKHPDNNAGGSHERTKLHWNLNGAGYVDIPDSAFVPCPAEPTPTPTNTPTPIYSPTPTLSPIPTPTSMPAPPACDVTLLSGNTSLVQGDISGLGAWVNSMTNGTVRQVRFESRNPGLLSTSPVSDSTLPYSTTVTAVGVEGQDYVDVYVDVEGDDGNDYAGLCSKSMPYTVGGFCPLPALEVDSECNYATYECDVTWSWPDTRSEGIDEYQVELYGCDDYSCIPDIVTVPGSSYGFCDGTTCGLFTAHDSSESRWGRVRGFELDFPPQCGPGDTGYSSLLEAACSCLVPVTPPITGVVTPSITPSITPPIPTPYSLTGEVLLGDGLYLAAQRYCIGAVGSAVEPGTSATVRVLGGVPPVDVRADGSYGPVPIDAGVNTIILEGIDTVQYECECGGSGTTCTYGGVNIIGDTSLDFYVEAVVYDPWWQTTGGDVGADSSGLACELPDASEFVSMSTGDLDSGVLTYSGSLDFGGNPNGFADSPYNWQAQSTMSAPIEDFAYFRDDVLELVPGVNAIILFSGSDVGGLTGPEEYYYVEGDAEVNSSWNVGGSDKITVMVEGELDINANITVASGGFLAFIASDDIHIRSGVTQVQGIYISDNDLIVYSAGAGEVALAGEGTFVGWDLDEAGADFARGVQLERDLGDVENAINPAEAFVYRPDLILNAPNRFLIPSMIWQEAAP